MASSNEAGAQANVNAETTGDAALDAKKLAKKQQKEAEKLEKLEKFKQKQEKMAAQKKEAPASAAAKPEKAVKTERSEAVYTGPSDGSSKKDLSQFPDSYSPKFVEAAWDNWWSRQGFFKPEQASATRNVREAGSNPRGRFVIVLPPPNVTGYLHLGHALTMSIEDSLVRWHRMRGETTLWNAGTDHAGIATQVVVEKMLKSRYNQTRHDVGRERFLEYAFQWKEEKGNRIYEQLRKMGGSFDWDRARFTMEPMLSRAVQEAFVRMRDSGIIYRANRLVNWSCTLKSAISDIEVEKKELTGRTLLRVPGYEEKVEFGVLVSFAYKLVGSDEEIVVSTTRVETMLGDTAVAVHPDDERYKNLHGRLLQHPFSDRQFPVVCDTYVDRSFGSGAVKITPAHDHNDFELGQRHKLPLVQMLDDEGRVPNDPSLFGQFAGMKRFDARTAVMEALKQKNLYRGTQDNAMVVPTCSRSKDVVEPLLRPQWYVNCKEMCERAIRAVETGELRIIPSSFERVWYSWLSEARDWCISRQLWWGHRIPCYRARILDSAKATLPADFAVNEENEWWFSGHDEAEARTKAANRLGTSEDNLEMVQDEDVLDTWFSSALFPFSVFGWPDYTDDLEAFFPTTLLETGHDILFFWVARMVFLSQELIGRVPFRDVYLHPIIRDKYGRKMSKSLGNVVDPLHVVNGIGLQQLNTILENDTNLDRAEVEKAKQGQRESYPNGIPECGTDALRFSLCAYAQQSVNINLDVLRIQGYRFFANKLWNATRFALAGFSSCAAFQHSLDLASIRAKYSLAPLDRWILSRLALAVTECNDGFRAYDFPRVTTAVYNFWLYDFCDYYVEYSKPYLRGAKPAKADGGEQEEAASESTDSAAPPSDRQLCVLAIIRYCVDIGLRLLHPFMPFITEELYQRLPRDDADRATTPDEQLTICLRQYPDLNESDNVAAALKDIRDLDLENTILFVQDAIHHVRSIKSDYQLTNKTKPLITALCVNSNDSATRQTLEEYRDLISLLAGCGAITVLPEGGTIANAHGTVRRNVGGRCDVYVHLEGLIDIEKEIKKAQVKLTESQKKHTTLAESMKRADYDRVPEAIRTQNDERAKELEQEVEKLQQTIANFSLLR